MRWLMVDRFTELVRGERARAVRSVTLGEDHIHDHFPGFPTWPRSLIVEGLAQTGGVLVGLSTGFKEMVVLAKVEKVTFYDLVLPGELMTFDVDLEELREEGARIRGTVTVDGRKIAEGAIMFAHVGRETANITSGENVVFSKEFLTTLGVDPALQEEVAVTQEESHE